MAAKMRHTARTADLNYNKLDAAANPFLIELGKKMPFDMSKHMKKYYSKNKEEIKKKHIERYKANNYDILRRKMIFNLNNGQTKRPQPSTLKKYSLLYDNVSDKWA